MERYKLERNALPHILHVFSLVGEMLDAYFNARRYKLWTPCRVTTTSLSCYIIVVTDREDARSIRLYEGLFLQSYQIYTLSLVGLIRLGCKIGEVKNTVSVLAPFAQTDFADRMHERFRCPL